MAPELKALRWVIPATLAVLLSVEAARAETPVSVELVLALDSSISVDGFEFKLQMEGIARAFRNPEVIDLIERERGVAVTLFQWSGEVDESRMIPWRLLRDRASILAFADQVEATQRNPNREFTGIGQAIDFGVRLIVGNAYAGERLKIDISGDGADNIGTLTAETHRRAGAYGIVINGLPVLTRIVDYSDRIPTHTNVDYYGLETYYRNKVIRGPGAFVEIAHEYDDFARAFLRKLRREISPPPISRARPAPTRLAHADQAAP